VKKSPPILAALLSCLLGLFGFLLAATDPTPTVPRFLDKGQEAHLDKIVVSGDPEKRFLIESVGGGLAVIDYDNDGWMDLYVTNGGTIESTRSGQGGKFPGALYRNNRDGTFTDVTAQARVANKFWGKGALAFDFDSDGFQDLYLANYGPNILFRNNRDGTFTDVTAKAGVGDPRWSAAAAAADYDRDGKPDLFVVNYLDYDLNHLPIEGKFCSYRGITVACGPRGLKGAGDALYHNNGDGTFTDVSEQAGVSDREGYYGLAVAWGDFDNDGYPDLYVANDTTPHYLYHNNRNGTFTEIGAKTGVAYSEDGREQAGMGVEFEDYNNDEWLDIFVTNFSDDYNTVYRNTGKGYFADVSAATGIAEDSFPDLSWGVGLFDFNNDGLKDIFIANGHIFPQVDRYGIQISYRQQNKLYLNNGKERFLNVSGQAGSGLQILKSFRGAVFADFDNDGAMDVAVVALDDHPVLLMNQGVPGNHWILVRLEGTFSNRFGVGARVAVTTGESTQIREMKAGGSFASCNDPRAHFGLGKFDTIEELKVVWPSGNVSRLANVATNRIITIKEQDVP
jgi:enediyne biosynthesis protein E4